MSDPGPLCFVIGVVVGMLIVYGQRLFSAWMRSFNPKENP